MTSRERSGIWTSGSQEAPFAGHGASGKIRVLVVGGNDDYLPGLRAAIERAPDLEIVGEAARAEDGLEQAARLKPDVVLVDLDAPGAGGLDATRRLVDERPGTLVVVLGAGRDEEGLREARRAGASAYALKDAGFEGIMQAIRDVVAGQAPLLRNEPSPPRAGMPRPAATPPSSSPSSPPTSPASAASPVSRPSTGHGTEFLITSNEREILRMLVEGLTNVQIAGRMAVPEAMVRTYLSEIYRKLGLPGREAAARYARDRGLVD